MATRSQTPANIRNEKRAKGSRPPSYFTCDRDDKSLPQVNQGFFSIVTLVCQRIDDVYRTITNEVVDRLLLLIGCHLDDGGAF